MLARPLQVDEVVCCAVLWCCSCRLDDGSIMDYRIVCRRTFCLLHISSWLQGEMLSLFRFPFFLLFQFLSWFSFSLHRVCLFPSCLWSCLPWSNSSSSSCLPLSPPISFLTLVFPLPLCFHFSSSSCLPSASISHPRLALPLLPFLILVLPSVCFHFSSSSCPLPLCLHFSLPAARFVTKGHYGCVSLPILYMYSNGVHVLLCRWLLFSLIPFLAAFSLVCQVV